MQITVRAEGVTEAARDLRALGADIEEPTEALEDIGRVGADTAADLAPRLTGETARSITATTDRTSATISAPFPAGPINYKTNRFMDTAARDLDLKATDLLEAAINRSIERHNR